ncbi:MAG: cysteinyl-tRNA synthetase [Actinomycetota bacterium]|nr:cysteinyl-tRNA synthetase [Actinomycetota bacterium]
MSLRLFDSATHETRDFVPLVPGRVGMYVCGATPQARPHIGHLRSAIAFDVLRRWLVRTGHTVVSIRNVTDIDDKILVKSAEAGQEWWAHAYTNELAFGRAYDRLNVLRPTYEPRATGHIPDQIELVERLVAAGHAYPADDGSGDVYFDVRSWPAYGELTHQSVDDLRLSGDADAGEAARKRDPLDFALWKGAKPTEPATAAWPSPWGPGRPGWHLECSAMAHRYLGAEFDIHGGGLDLRFPHHENEQAQSRAAGDPFARFWLHNAWVVAGGEKMSKSLGNTMTVEALTRRVPASVVRYLLAVPHYRSHIEVVDSSLDEARTAYERIQQFVVRAAEIGPAVHELDAENLRSFVTLPPAFVAALDDDLGTPAAMAVVHETVHAGNTALAKNDKHGVTQAGLAVRAMTDVFGLDPLDPAWTSSATGPDDVAAATTAALDALVRERLDARATARADQDFQQADAIRDQLTAAGILVEDTRDGARWTVLRGAEGTR